MARTRCPALRGRTSTTGAFLRRATRNSGAGSESRRQPLASHSMRATTQWPSRQLPRPRRHAATAQHTAKAAAAAAHKRCAARGRFASCARRTRNALARGLNWGAAEAAHRPPLPATAGPGRHILGRARATNGRPARRGGGQLAPIAHFRSGTATGRRLESSRSLARKKPPFVMSPAFVYCRRLWNLSRCIRLRGWAILSLWRAARQRRRLWNPIGVNAQTRNDSIGIDAPSNKTNEPSSCNTRQGQVSQQVHWFALQTRVDTSAVGRRRRRRSYIVRRAILHLRKLFQTQLN